MPFIIPSILEQTREGLDDKIFQVTRITGVERVQIDFGDGDFVPHTTLTVNELDPLNPAFQWEAHLMVRAPGNFLDYQIAGFTTIILHYEAFGTEQLLDDAASEIKKLGMKPGVAINPETPVSVLRYFGDTINHFTLLSVHPGAQGNPFLPQTPERVRQLRALLPHVEIEVDGGINQDTLPALKGAGADSYVIGSALYAAKSPQEAYQILCSMV